MDQLNIFMPCYNAEAFLAETLESLLHQQYQKFHLIVVDDGSTDRSLNILKKYAEKDGRIKVFRNDGNKGVCYTRNRGLELCDSKYIALMDSDDIAPCDRLRIQMEFLQSHPETDIVCGNYQLMTEDGIKKEQIIVPECKHEDVKAALFFHNVIATGTVVMRKRTVQTHNLKFSEGRFALEDYQFWTDAIAAGARIEILPEILQYYRIVESGLSRSNTKNRSKERNGSFDKIHEDLLNIFHIDLTEQQKETYFLFTHEHYPYYKKILFQSRIRELFQSLKCQADKTGVEKAFLKQCDIFYHKWMIGKRRICGG